MSPFVFERREVAQRRMWRLGRLCRHSLSLTTRLGDELLRDRNQERLLRDDFANFEALSASGHAALKKDHFREGFLLF